MHRWLTLSSVVFLAFTACGEVNSLDSSNAGTSCGPEGCFAGDGLQEAGVSDVSTDIGNDVGSEAGTVNPLCGVLNCDPDDFEATKCNPVGATDAGSFDDAGPDGAWEDAEDADAEHEDDASSGSNGSMGGGQSPGQLPSPEMPQDEPDNPVLACQVTKDTDGNRVAMCVAGGTGVDNDPCVTSSDCSAGYACVGDANAGVCRSYCCLDPEACPSGTYCGVLPSRDEVNGTSEEKFLLPVCIPANDCELLPGPEGTNRCGDGLMCGVVRADGTTACVTPGTSEDGESCGPSGPGQSPCAEGFICSKSTNTCMELCRVNSPDSCGEAVCQGGTNGLPDEYGICVGARG